MYENDIQNLVNVFKDALGKLQNKSYHTKSFKADVQYNHIVNFMKKFNDCTDFLGPQSSNLTENLSFTFQHITDGTTGFGVPYHTVKRHEIVNCKKDINLVKNGTYEQIDGLNSNESVNIKQLEKIIKSNHKYAVRTAQSNNKPWDTFKPLNNETVMAIATYMLNVAQCNVRANN